MASAENENGRSWPPAEPVMPYFQIKLMPRRLHKRLKLLATLIEKGMAETACEVIEEGLRIAEAKANEQRTD